jgi:outer membrane protein
MKKNALLVAVLGLGTLPALAQTERGSKLIGVSVGDLQYARSREQGNNYVSAALHPTLGYFVADNLALGSSLTLSYSRQKTDNGYYSTTAQYIGYGLAPFARYYFLGSGKHRVFGEVGVDFTRQDYRVKRNVTGFPEATPTKRHDNLWGYHTTLGYNYFLTPNAALEVSAGYQRFGRDELTGRRSAVDVRAGFNIFLGGPNN